MTATTKELGLKTLVKTLINMKLSDFADVEPIEQDDGPNPFVNIAYPHDYAVAMGYFRALLLKNEVSNRMLSLTSEILDWNPGHYTVWTVRFNTVKSMLSIHSNLDEKDSKGKWTKREEGEEKDSDILAQEVQFVETLALENPKSYQLWHYRQGLSTLRGTLGNDLEFVDSMLAEDAKNYHAWSYRQWLVSQFNLWDQEMDAMAYYIDSDVYNNSAWNQRFFVLSNRPVSEDELKSEVAYTLLKLDLAPGNESPWNYLKGILSLSKNGFNDFKGIEQACLKYASATPSVIFALSTLVDIYKDRQDNTLYMETCSKLETLDFIRSKYWSFKKMLL